MTVYVVQKQMRFDNQTQEFVPRFDLSTAEQYGEIQFLLSPTASPFNTDTIIPELHESLIYFKEEDFLLLIGNPVLIGLCTAVAADYCNSINFLQWHGKEQKYIPIRTKDILRN